MTVSLVQLAKSGDADSIATLINQQLSVRKITSKASIKNKSLQIILESEVIPTEEALVGFLKKGIINLKPQGIEKVKIYGKNLGDDFPEWSSEFELVSESNPFSIDNTDKIGSENVVLINSKNLQKSSETVQEFEAHGKNGIIRLTKNRVIISREGYWGFISQGESGSKEIPIKNITAVQFKSCSATTGFIQFTIIGGIEASGGVFSAVKNENTVLFLEDQESNFREVKRYVDSIIDGEPIELSDLKYTASMTVHELGLNVAMYKPIVMPKVVRDYFDNLRTNKDFVGFCAIFLGELGVHKFLLGSYRAGSILLGITILFSIHSIFLMFLIKTIVIIEGITYIIMPSKVFQRRYIHNRRVWFLF